MSVLAGYEAQVVLNTILQSPRFQGWDGFIDGHWAIFISPHTAITQDDMENLRAFYVDQIGAVFRDHPTPGVYLRCRLLDPMNP